MKTTVQFCASPADGTLVQTLYKELLEYWETGNAISYAGLFTTGANVIGFDGSQMNGKEDIEKTLAQIFSHHKVAAYVAIIEEVRPLCDTVYLLRAVVGMIAPGADVIMPERNAIQTMVAQKQFGSFEISLFQNTPAAFHGRPEISKQLTERLAGVQKTAGQ